MGKQRLPQEIQRYFDVNGVQNPYTGAYDGRVPELESIEKEEVSSSALTSTELDSVRGEHPSTSSNIRVADLYDLVNGEYQKYLPQKGQGNPAYAQGSSFDKLLHDISEYSKSYILYYFRKAKNQDFLRENCMA